MTYTDDAMPAATRELRAALIDILEFVKVERMRLSSEPSIGSPAGKDDLQAHRYTSIVGVPTKEARMLGAVYLAQADEFIRALDVLYSDGLAIVVADKVLWRSALEVCGRAYWLLDPAIDTRQRVGRSLVVRLQDLRATKRMLPRMEVDFTNQIANLREQIVAAGFEITHDKRRGDMVDGVHLPTQAEAMELAIGSDPIVGGLSSGGLAQRYLSLAVHGHPSSLLLHRAGDDELQEMEKGTVPGADCDDLRRCRPGHRPMCSRLRAGSRSPPQHHAVA